ncbi:hypothetical protein ABPG72_020804 [Tetrahymena utriculariae]
MNKRQNNQGGVNQNRNQFQQVQRYSNSFKTNKLNNFQIFYSNSLKINQNDQQEEEKKKQQIDSSNLAGRRLPIMTKFNEINKDLRKDITFYYFLLEQLDEDKICRELSKIYSYENSLPFFNEIDHLITFLQFISKLIIMINNKQQIDIESSKKNLPIFKETVYGFLVYSHLEKCILYWLNKRENQSSNNRKKQIEIQEKLKSLVKDVINYLRENNINTFQELQKLFFQPCGLDFSKIQEIVKQGSNYNCLFQTLEDIYEKLIEFNPQENQQIEQILLFIEFLIKKQKEVQEFGYKEKQETILEKCIMKCLQIEQLIKYLSNYIGSNTTHDKNKQFVQLLHEIAQYEPKNHDKILIEKYKIILYDIHQEKEANQLSKDINFDEDLIQMIKDELIIAQGLPNYKVEIDLNTNIIPNDEDCRDVKNYRGHLKRINLKKKYMNKLEYLSNMFNFIRADSHQELVQGMNCAIQIGSKICMDNFRDFTSMQKELSHLKTLNAQFNFYNNIEIINIKFQKGLTLTLLVQPILPKKNMKLRLDSSRRLIGDQCLYLTDYKFTKLISCQLENEQLNPNLKALNHEYNNIRIKLRVTDPFQQSSENLEQIKSNIYNKNAILVEPKIYYGQYTQCMQAIKDMITNNFRLPFYENLLHLEKKINMPAFINENTEYYLDFSPLFIPQQQNSESHNSDKYLQQLIGDWSKIPTLKYVNQSQANAIKNILTKQISIIQGPPGTGKTYVGALAIRNILQNSNVWNPENNVILMCCKTNHALDQFLSHIIKFENDVIRVGGRIKLPEIEPFKLSLQRKKYFLQAQSYFFAQEMEKKLNESLKYFSDYLFQNKDYEDLISMLPKSLVKSCCKIFLRNFEEVLLFLKSKADQILEVQHFYNLISSFWWQFNPQISYMRKRLFYPLIDQYGQDDDDKKILKEKIQMHLPQFANQNQQNFQKLSKAFYDQRKETTNYFYEDSKDDKLDQKIDNVKEDSLFALWQKVLTFRETPKMKEYFYDDDEIDEQEYTENRDEYQLDDELENPEEEDLDENFSTFQQKSTPNKKIEIHQPTYNSILKLTYYQFMESTQELKYDQLASKILSGEKEDLFLTDEITIRLKAISEFSQIQQKELFKPEDLKQYEQQINKLKKEEMLNDVKIMKQKKIVAMTLGGICKYSEYLKHLKYDILLIEEAAEVLENLSVPLLQPFLKQMILIGDHQQLKPTVNSYLMEKEFNMNVSLFQRLIANNVEYECLKEQMRMAPEFSEYVRLIYKKPNQYLDSEKVKLYDRTFRGFPSNMMFFMHSSQEMNLNYTTTKKNEYEAQLSVALADYIVKVKQYTPVQITILAMYLGQAIMIKQIINNTQDLKDIKVYTIDNYQGEENEIIILSLVRSSPNRLGFVKTQNRINVSISRAKKGFIILGNKNLLSTQIPLWKQIFQKAASKNHIFEDQFSVKCPQHQKKLTFSDPKSFSQNQNGGCNKICDKQNLTCQHKCKYKCHYGDCDKFDCKQLVDWEFKQCGHSAKVECFKQKNGELKCNEKIKIKNQICGHDFNVECFKFNYEQKMLETKFYDEFYTSSCQSKCGKKLMCDHNCKQKCHPDKLYCNQEVCDEIITKKQACGHQYNGKCGEFIKHTCKEIVDVQFNVCGHSGKVECFQKQQKDLQCKKVVKLKNQKCGHDLQVECYQLDYDHSGIKSTYIDQLQQKKCESKCRKVLECGHFCKQECHLNNTPCDQTFCEEIIKKQLPCGCKYNGKCRDQYQYKFKKEELNDFKTKKQLKVSQNKFNPTDSMQQQNCQDENFTHNQHDDSLSQYSSDEHITKGQKRKFVQNKNQQNGNGYRSYKKFESNQKPAQPNKPLKLSQKQFNIEDTTQFPSLQ